MTPVKRKQVVETTAAELGVHPDIVDSIVCFYYKKIQKLLSGATHLNVQVPGLGTFNVSKRNLLNKRLRMDGLIKKLEQSSSMQAYAIAQSKKLELGKLNLLQELVDVETQRKTMTTQIRHAYEQSADNLEREKKDPGRNTEQSL